MSGEAALWAYVRNGMRGRWSVQRHEDRMTAGIPDLSYAIDGADGWIELKSMAAWPVRPGTRVDVGITPEQVLWAEQRGAAGSGRCFVLIRVGREHLLVRWNRARNLLRETITKDEVRAIAEGGWSPGIDWPFFAYMLATACDDKEIRND